MEATKWPWARQRSPRRRAGSTQGRAAGGRAHRSPSHAQPGPGAGSPESWAVGSLPRGSPSHPRSGAPGPGVGGRTLKALTRGLGLEGRSQRPGVSGQCQWGGGAVCSLPGATWLCSPDPPPPVGMGPLRAGWRRRPTLDPPPAPAGPAEHGGQSRKQERKLVVRALLVTGAAPRLPEQLGLVVGGVREPGEQGRWNRAQTTPSLESQEGWAGGLARDPPRHLAVGVAGRQEQGGLQDEGAPRVPAGPLPPDTGCLDRKQILTY